MRVFNFVSLVYLGAASASIIKRATSDPDFSGNGNLFVIPGKNIQTEDPNNRIGCLTNSGRFVTDTTKCGVFTQQDSQPLRSQAGTCSFSDPTAEPGRPQAPQGYAFKCSPTTPTGSIFYSFVGSNGELDAGPGLAWIWTGNLNAYYEAKSVPAPGSDASLWYYTGGVDPPTDKAYFMLLWKKIS